MGRLLNFSAPSQFRQASHLFLFFNAVLVAAAALVSPFGEREPTDWVIVPAAAVALYWPAALIGTMVSWKSPPLGAVVGAAVGLTTTLFVFCDAVAFSAVGERLTSSRFWAAVFGEAGPLRDGPDNGVAISLVVGLAAFVVVELGFLWAARTLAIRGWPPEPTRLASAAFLVKLSVLGLLAASFVAPERNPLGVLRWYDPPRPVAEQASAFHATVAQRTFAFDGDKRTY